MPFFRIMCQHYLHNGPDTCKVSLVRLSGRARSIITVGLRVVLGTDLLATLGAATGDKLELMWGDGPDAGSVLVTKATVGVTIGRTRAHKGGTGTLAFVNMPTSPICGVNDRLWTLLMEPREAHPVEWRQEDGGIVITLPRVWWKVDASEESDARKQLQRLTTIPMPPKRDVA